MEYEIRKKYIKGRYYSIRIGKVIFSECDIEDFDYRSLYSCSYIEKAKITGYIKLKTNELELIESKFNSNSIFIRSNKLKLHKCIIKSNIESMLLESSNLDISNTYYEGTILINSNEKSSITINNSVIKNLIIEGESKNLEIAIDSKTIIDKVILRCSKESLADILDKLDNINIKELICSNDKLNIVVNKKALI